MRRLRKWKGLWRRSLTRSYKRTSMGPSRSCWNGTTRRRLTRRGLEFHVCTINKSAHTKKVWKIIVCTSYLLWNCSPILDSTRWQQKTLAANDHQSNLTQREELKKKKKRKTSEPPCCHGTNNLSNLHLQLNWLNLLYISAQDSSWMQHYMTKRDHFVLLCNILKHLSHGSSCEWLRAWFKITLMWTEAKKNSITS